MDKRTEKLRQSLALMVLRLKDNQLLQRIEIETPRGGNELSVSAGCPGLLRTDGGKEVPLEALAGYLERELQGTEKAWVRFVERGALVTLKVPGGHSEFQHSGFPPPSVTGGIRHPPALYKSPGSLAPFAGLGYCLSGGQGAG